MDVKTEINKKNDDAIIKVNITGLFDTKKGADRDAFIEDIVKDLMFTLGHSFSYFDFLKRRDAATIAWFNSMRRKQDRGEKKEEK